MEGKGKDISSPARLIRTFRRELSLSAVFMLYVSVIYFSFTIILSTIIFTMFDVEEKKLFSLEFLYYIGIVLVIVGIALLVCAMFMKYKFNMLGIDATPRDWKDSLLKWQKEKLIQEMAFDKLSRDKKLDLLDSYVVEVNNRLEAISPFIKPAIATGLILPVYSIFLDKYFSFATSLESLFVAFFLVVLCLMVIYYIYFLGLQVSIFISNEREDYKELLRILKEISFDLKYADPKR